MKLKQNFVKSSFKELCETYSRLSTSTFASKSLLYSSTTFGSIQVNTNMGFAISNDPRTAEKLKLKINADENTEKIFLRIQNKSMRILQLLADLLWRGFPSRFTTICTVLTIFGRLFRNQPHKSSKSALRNLPVS